MGVLNDGFFKLTVGAAILVVTVTVFLLGTPDFPLDDAYIVQHSVSGLFKGADPRFPEATALQGTTSPFHVLLVFLVGRILPVGWAQFLVSAVFYVVFVAGVYRLARQQGLSGSLAAALALLATVSGMSYYHFFNGLETGLAIAAVTWALILFHDPLPNRNRHIVLLGVLPFIRPELAVLSVLFGARIVWGLRHSNSPGERAAAMFGWLLVAALVPTGFVLLANGAVVPTTISAKAYFFAEGCGPWRDKVEAVGRIMSEFLSTIGIAGLGIAGVVATRQRYLALGFLAAFLSAYLVFLPGALHHNKFRYLQLFAPFLILGWAGLLSLRGKAVALTTRSGLAVAILSSVILLPHAVLEYSDSIKFTRRQMGGVARWGEDNLPADEAVLVHDAGYISLHGPQPLVDLVGLKTPSSTQVHRELTWKTCSRDPRALEEIARRNDARFFIALGDWDRTFGLVAAFKARDWRIERVDAERGETEYKVYRIAPKRRAAVSGAR